MHKKSFVLCGTTCIAGVFGAFARWLQNATVFEAETGLARPGALWSVIMAVYLCLCAAAFLIVTRRLTSGKKLVAGTQYPAAFSGGAAVCGASAVLSLGLMAVGGIAQTISALRAGKDTFGLIGGLGAIAAAICVFYILRSINAKRQRSGGAAFITVILFLCFRLVAEYKESAADPVMWHYAIRILAICAVILAFYYLAGHCFGKAKTGKTIYFCILGVFLSVITFADGISMEYHLVTAGLALAVVTLLLLFVGNMLPAKADADSQ